MIILCMLLFYLFFLQDNARHLACYCSTVFKRFRLLAGCALLTDRHVLTTATSTELILRKRRHFKTLEEVLGLWYETDANDMNVSRYASVAKIDYHPSVRIDIIVYLF